MITGMNHVGISVADLDRSVAFYRDVLGMDLLDQKEFEGEQYGRIFRLKGAAGRGAFLKQKGCDLRIELFEFYSPTPKQADPERRVCDHGITHFCISVEDIEAEYARMRAAGVSFHCPPLTFSASGNRAAYARDPDGNVFELHEKGSWMNPNARR